MFRSQPLNLCIVVPCDEMHSMSHTLRPMGSWPTLPCPFHFIKSQISQKLFRPPPLNHIYYFSVTHTLCPSGVTLFQLFFVCVCVWGGGGGGGQNACVWMRMALGEGIRVILTFLVFLMVIKRSW